jgi:hypothetical protein
MSETAQEFYDLCMRYIDLHGDPGSDDYWEIARLGRLRMLRTSRRLIVEHIVKAGPLDTLKPVWSNEGGFQYEDWHVYLEQLRTALILDRIADV